MVFLFAVYFKVFSEEELPARLLAAILGVVITAVITQLLLKGQGDKERNAKRSAKVFEERLVIYKAFLQKLCDVVQDLKIEPQEEIQLQFQVANIAMHTGSQSIREISENVREIIVKITNGEDDRNDMLAPLFNIANVFTKELYESTEDVIKVDSEDWKNTLLNFHALLVQPETMDEYQRDVDTATRETFGNNDKLTIKQRLELIGALTNGAGFKRYNYGQECLVHDMCFDHSPKTGKYIKGPKTVAVDLCKDGDKLSIVIFTRAYDENATRKLVEGLWQGKEPYKQWNAKAPHKHLYRTFSIQTPAETIAQALSELLSQIAEYRKEVEKRDE